MSKFTEEITVAGRDLKKIVQQLLSDATVDRFKIVNKKNGKTVIDVPALVGVPTLFIMNVWAVVGAAFMYMADYTVVISRNVTPSADEDIEIVIEDDISEEDINPPATMESLAEENGEAAEVAEAVVETAEAVVDEAVETAEEIVEDAAEVVEAITEAAEEASGDEDPPMILTISAEPVAEEVQDSAETVEYDQCQGTTKSGKQCKRKPMDDSAYCYSHQPA